MTRRAGFWIAVVTTTALAQGVLQACPVCFQFEEGPTVTGVRAAVFVLVGVTAVVLSGCGAFAMRLARRDAAALPPDERATP